jgi:hypothetical protein
MLLLQYLQTIVTTMISGSIIVKLSQDIYKTREKQKTRNGLLKLNWTIFKIRNTTKEENNQQYQPHFLKQYFSKSELNNDD